MLFVRSFKNLKRLFASTDKLFASPLLGVLAAMIVPLSSVYAQNRSPLHLEKEIPLPGVRGRIDHFSADVRGRRMFIAALENEIVRGAGY